MPAAHLSEAARPFAEIAPDLVVPPSLELVVMTCLARERDQRFADAHQLLRALRDRAG